MSTSVVGNGGSPAAGFRGRARTTWPTSPSASKERLHAEILEAVKKWPPEVQVDWNEMAATLEYDQGNDRRTAEQLAFFTIRRKLERERNA